MHRLFLGSILVPESTFRSASFPKTETEKKRPRKEAEDDENEDHTTLTEKGKKYGGTARGRGSPERAMGDPTQKQLALWGRTQKETRSIRFELANALTWLKSLSANPTNTHQLFLPSSSSQGLALSKFPFVRRPFSLRREKSDRERLWSKKLDRQEETAEGKRQPS